MDPLYDNKLFVDKLNDGKVTVPLPKPNLVDDPVTVNAAVDVSAPEIESSPGVTVVLTVIGKLIVSPLVVMKTFDEPLQLNCNTALVFGVLIKDPKFKFP
jgi:hypothetical protein